jgi:hypothetical protein
VPEEFGLSADEIAEAERVIRRAPADLYTLVKLYGADWDTKRSPTTFGARFKASVVAGRLSGISLHPHKTGANAIQYLVHYR